MSASMEETRLIQKLNRFEVQCVTGNFTTEDFEIDLENYKFSHEFELIQDLKALMINISHHDYKEALQTKSEFFKSFKDRCKDLTLVFYETYSQMKSNYQHLFHSGDEDCSYVKQLILLLVGVSALQEFVKFNVCGPVELDATIHEICSSFLPDSHFSNHSILLALGKNGEVILQNIVYPKLLFVSLMLLFGNNFDKCLTHKWWLSRCMMIHQKMLPDNSFGLYQSISSLLQSQAEISFLSDNSELLAAVMFNCECAQFSLHYNELNVAERCIINAQNILGLGVKLSNICVRSLDKSGIQNGVVVKRNDKRYRSSLITYNSVFPNCFFEPENRKIALLDHDGKDIDDLLPEEQVVLLLYCHLIMKRGYDSLYSGYCIDDLLMLDCLLSKPLVWSLQMKALILRCKRKGYVGREHINTARELISHVTNALSFFSHKLVLFYCASLPMLHDVYKMLADLLFSEGSVLEASRIYDDFNLYKGSINCYKHIDEASVGIKLVEELISIKPSPLLWCYLGNLKNEPEMYQVAWDLSKHTNARAARYMGNYFYKKKMYGISISHFQESLKLNPMQQNVLLRMGLAAMVCEDFKLAIDAFNGIIEMDADNCEAWIYLCEAYIKTDDKMNACRCFLETQTLFDKLKNETQYKKFWENYRLISAKIGAFSDAMTGFKPYPDSHLPYPVTSSDVEVLKILVNAIKTSTPDINELRSPRLRRKVISLFQTLTSRGCHNPFIWELYSVLLCVRADFRNDVQNTKNILACQQRAIKHYIGQLEKDNYSYKPLLKLLLKCIHLFDIYQMKTMKKEINRLGRPSIYLRFLNNAVLKVKNLIPASPEAEDLMHEIEQKFHSIL